MALTTDTFIKQYIDYVNNADSSLTLDFILSQYPEYYKSFKFANVLAEFLAKRSVGIINYATSYFEPSYLTGKNFLKTMSFLYIDYLFDVEAVDILQQRMVYQIRHLFSRLAINELIENILSILKVYQLICDQVVLVNKDPITFVTKDTGLLLDTNTVLKRLRLDPKVIEQLTVPTFTSLYFIGKIEYVKEIRTELFFLNTLAYVAYYNYKRHGILEKTLQPFTETNELYSFLEIYLARQFILHLIGVNVDFQQFLLLTEDNEYLISEYIKYTYAGYFTTPEIRDKVVQLCVEYVKQRIFEYLDFRTYLQEHVELDPLLEKFASKFYEECKGFKILEHAAYFAATTFYDRYTTQLGFEENLTEKFNEFVSYYTVDLTKTHKEEFEVFTNFELLKEINYDLYLITVNIAYYTYVVKQFPESECFKFIATLIDAINYYLIQLKYEKCLLTNYYNFKESIASFLQIYRKIFPYYVTFYSDESIYLQFESVFETLNITDLQRALTILIYPFERLPLQEHCEKLIEKYNNTFYAYLDRIICYLPYTGVIYYDQSKFVYNWTLDGVKPDSSAIDNTKCQSFNTIYEDIILGEYSDWILFEEFGLFKDMSVDYSIKTFDSNGTLLKEVTYTRTRI